MATPLHMMHAKHHVRISTAPRRGHRVCLCPKSLFVGPLWQHEVLTRRSRGSLLTHFTPRTWHPLNANITLWSWRALRPNITWQFDTQMQP